MSDQTTHIKKQLITAYDADAARRVKSIESREKWKVTVRQKFAELAKNAGLNTVLEIGAGIGLDAAYFQSQGFSILATDLSPKMIEACMQQGLDAKVLDLYQLDKLDRQFDAIYSLNVLLHVPHKDLKDILNGIHHTLNPQGLFFYGTYGGVTKEEEFTDSHKVNFPRFFSFLDDAALIEIVSPLFEIVDFSAIAVDQGQFGLHFQSLTLRKI